MFGLPSCAAAKADSGNCSAPRAVEATPIAPSLNVEALKAAIVDSQQHGQKFPRFSARAMEAGVQAYYAFLRGKRVTYFGRNGDHHVEWFPGAQPDTNS